jgi:hypothetical protein
LIAREIGRITIILYLLLAGGVAWAGPPFLTDDPETPAWHGWEINIPFTLERTPHELAVQMPLFDLNYGFFPNVQLKVEFPLLFVHPEDGSQQLGLGDTLIGVKWRFFEEGQRSPQLGIYPQALLPTGSSRRGLGEGRPSFLLPLMAQKTWGKATLYGDIGYVAQTGEGARNFWYGGAVFLYELTEGLKLGGELFGNSAKQVGGRSALAFNLGGQWKIREGYNLLFSAGPSIWGESKTMLYVGLQILTKGIE